jgi:hypothetical protein
MVELTHGYRSTETFAVGVLPENLHRIHQEPHSSYEVVVDSTSGDIGDPPTTPVKLDRIDGVGTVLGTSVGAGPTQSLRWANTSSTANSGDLVRVASTTCTTNCGADDQYRIRAYDTTYAIARFNNSATQTTNVVIQNATAASVDVKIYFWNASGTLIYTHPATLAAKSEQVLGTAGFVPNASGSITIANNAPYGRLSGKAVATEAASGFTFDTLMAPRAR